MKLKIVLITGIIFALALVALAASNKSFFFDDLKINGTIAESITRLSDPDDPSDGEVLAVRGLPHHKAMSTDDRCLWLPRYRRPEKPEQVVVTIHTKDGRKWVARWEEVKP